MGHSSFISSSYEENFHTKDFFKFASKQTINAKDLQHWEWWSLKMISGIKSVLSPTYFELTMYQ